MYFKKIILIVVLFSFFNQAFSTGKVYLVIGSDTAIWTGMNVARFHCTYDQSLYTDPSRNAYRVMDPAFRADLVDSYGQPMKMTWWMMAGNIFRYATNTNVPVPNIMTLYLMKKYHSENILANGDELTLHYHTFVWTDYDGDGRYYWNQAKNFLESLDDFNVTLAQFLLEEQVFPVSFRSGWHYMDNDWQKYLDDRVLPYSLHNDYPAKRTEDPEPIDNIYDWSQAPSAFVPYRPSRENYQLPGDGPGWQVRSAHIWKARVNDYMDTVFAAAQQGTDQVACFWGHLPESDFLENLQKIDSVAHHCEEKYPGVKFRYCTAVEAMQRWRQVTDFEAPVLQFSDEVTGDEVYFNIESDEPIFQQQPFVAVKNIYEEYFVLECEQTGINQWRTVQPVPLSTLAKAGVTACDSLGNQAMAFISYLPNDAFIDNQDQGYAETQGYWSTSSSYSWGTDSRTAILSENDSATAVWTYSAPQAGNYNIFIQFPDLENRVERMRFRILVNQLGVDTVEATSLLPAKQWDYLSTVQLDQASEIAVEMAATGKGQAGKQLVADVVKITALVREKDIAISEELIDFGQVSEEDTADYVLTIANRGIQNLQVFQIYSQNQTILVNQELPITIPPMSDIEVTLSFAAVEIGTIRDTLMIVSDDPQKPTLTLSISAEVTPYFHIIDNEDLDQYQEYGSWHYSVANIYGPTSRYAYLNASPRASACFHTQLKRSGIYELFEIVPSTVNSTDDALYQVKVDGQVQASFHVDQNKGSGNWVSLGKLFLPADTDIELWVIDTGQSSYGDVIRTDAVRFSLVEEGTDIESREGVHPPTVFRLEQNYPNPFGESHSFRSNSRTMIRYQIGRGNGQPVRVDLSVYNTLGQKVFTLVNKMLPAGSYQVEWDASDFSSGIYFYRLQTDQGFVCTRKLILLK